MKTEISKQSSYSARQSKLAFIEYSLKTQFLVLEYSLDFMSKNQHRLWF